MLVSWTELGCREEEEARSHCPLVLWFLQLWSPACPRNESLGGVRGPDGRAASLRCRLQASSADRRPLTGASPWFLGDASLGPCRPGILE